MKKRNILKFIPLLLCLSSSVLSAQVAPVKEKTVPLVTRDKGRHEMVNAKIEKQSSYDILMLGDSITHLLDEPKHLNKAWHKNSGENSKYVARQLRGKTILNAGISGENTVHLLSRLQNGLSKVKSKYTTIMIGTNDARTKLTADQVAKNIEEAIKIVNENNADTQILLYAIFPRGNSEKDAARVKNQAVNKILATYPKKFKNVKFININKDLKERNGTVSTEMMYDRLHPTLKGYKVWIKSIKRETK